MILFILFKVGWRVNVFELGKSTQVSGTPTIARD